MPVGLEDRLDELMARLAAADAGSSRRAGEQLLAVGAPAVPRLLAALAGDDAELRKAASFLLGRLGGRAPDAGAVTRALARALADDEPKVRKNAAVALGRVAGARDADAGASNTAAKGEADVAADSGEAGTVVRALAEALQRETIAWVRPSLILALGATGDAAADAVLAGVHPQSSAETEALRKAADRLRPAPPRVRWQPEAALPAPLWAAVPPGLEDVARSEIADELGEPAGDDGGRPAAPPGRLRLPDGTRAADALARLRCILDVRLLLAEGLPLHGGEQAGVQGGEQGGEHGVEPAEVPRRVADLLAATGALAGWRRWLRLDGDALPYRFALDGLRLPKAAFLATLAAVRGALEPHGLRDSPSSYALQLTVEATATATRLWLLPSFVADARFAYRRQDVGAAIQPAVAAGLVRLLRGERPAARPRQVLDPTCGSATLLVERARLAAAAGESVELRGLDVSPTAVRAAVANVAAAGLAGRIRIERADAAEARCWRPVDEVVANLPFGRRSRRRDPDLERLYARLVHNLARSLRSGGRALLYTANRDLLAAALAGVLVDRGGSLELCEERDVEAGGLRVGVWVLQKA